MFPGKKKGASNYLVGKSGIAAVALLSGCFLEQGGEKDPAEKVKEEEEVNECEVVFPSDAVLAPYVNLLTGSLEIKEAIDFCNTSPAFQNNLWDKIKQAEETGDSPTAPLPKSFSSLEPDQGSILVNREEAEEIYAAHVAHSLWMDKNGLVSWKLSDYPAEELEKLLAPRAWFSAWSPQEEKYRFSLILDHSPNTTYSVIKQIADPALLNDQESALVEIIKSMRYFRHVTVFKNSDGEVECSDLTEIITMGDMFKEKISRHGCQTMAPYVVQLANALNIPGETVRGYFTGVGGHRTALFKFTDQVLTHGDDVYNSYLGNTPSEEIMGSYTFWENEVMSFPKGNPEGAHNSLAQNQENSLDYVSKSLMRSYCEYGRAYLDQLFLEYTTKKRLDLLESELLLRTENCTNYPENDPDGTGNYNNNSKCSGTSKETR